MSRHSSRRGRNAAAWGRPAIGGQSRCTRALRSERVPCTAAGPGAGGAPGSSPGASDRRGLPFRQRLVGWRKRNWRRVILAWFVLSMIIMMVAAEPKTDFPRAQARSVPAVQTFLRVAGGLTVAGVPVLLIALP